MCSSLERDAGQERGISCFNYDAARNCAFFCFLFTFCLSTLSPHHPLPKIAFIQRRRDPSVFHESGRIRCRSRALERRLASSRLCCCVVVRYFFSFPFPIFILLFLYFFTWRVTSFFPFFSLLVHCLARQPTRHFSIRFLSSCRGEKKTTTTTNKRAVSTQIFIRPKPAIP